MSIDISSEDSNLSSDDLPVVCFAKILSKNTSPILHDIIESTECKENNGYLHNIDLTQEDAGYKDEAIVLSGSSSRSHHGEQDKLRSDSPLTDSTIEMDNDAMFDEMVLPTSMLKVAISGTSSLSGMSSTSSGYESGGLKRKKAGEDVKEVKQKKMRSAEKATKRQQLTRERLERQAASELNKIYKPGECMKHMVIEVHPSLLSAWFMSDLAREAAPSRVSEELGLCHPGLVLWSRREPPRLGKDGQLELTNGRRPCDRALLIQTADEIAPYVCEHRVASYVAEVQAMVGCPLTLVVFGVKDYFKCSGRKKKSNTVNLMTEIDLEMAFTDLIVSSNCDSVAVDTPNQLALLIMQFTKAIAEAPYKQAKRAMDEQADFYMRGDNKKCVSVDKDGHGLSRLWQQMLSILHLSSLETSRAVCANYKSPLQLYEALRDADGVNELANIGIDRAGLPGTKFRRLGPEFARKLKILFTSNDGDMLVD